MLYASHVAIARKYRLSKKDIEYVFKGGKTVKSSFLFIRFLENDLNYARIAVIVTRKIFKKATDRNRLKRIITETIRSGYYLERSFDIAIVTTLNIVGKPSKEIKRELEQTLNKIFV